MDGGGIEHRHLQFCYHCSTALETLQTPSTCRKLADGGFQIANTAKALGIHISRLRDNIRRIESILKFSLDDPKRRFQLQVAAALYRLRED